MRINILFYGHSVLLIQAANEMESLEHSGVYMKPVMNAIDQYYNSNPPTPGYQSYVTKEKADTRYYDDNQWGRHRLYGCLQQDEEKTLP